VLHRQVVFLHPREDRLGLRDVLGLGEQPQQLAEVGRVRLGPGPQCPHGEVERGRGLLGVQQGVHDADEVAGGRGLPGRDELTHDLHRVPEPVGAEPVSYTHLTLPTTPYV